MTIDNFGTTANGRVYWHSDKELFILIKRASLKTRLNVSNKVFGVALKFWFIKKLTFSVEYVIM